MPNTVAKASEWIDRLASHSAIPFGELLRKSFAAGRLTRLCDCGCNSFELEVPDSGSIPRLANPDPDEKGNRLMFEIVFDTGLEDPAQLACLFFADTRGYLSAVDITGGQSNHAPVPEVVELRSVYYCDGKSPDAL